MEDGSTVIAVSDYATKNTVDLYAVSASCVPVREFGRAGRATVTPSSRPPAHTDFETLPDALWVNAVTPSNGGALIAGAYGGRWMVGAVTREGRVDPTFGNGGWAVLPFHGAVTAILRAPSGRIVVAGESRGPMWVAALSARGHLERGFGTDGRAMLPPLGADAGVTGLAVEPSGEVLANIAFGSTGCWGDALVRLTPSGRPARSGRSWVHSVVFGSGSASAPSSETSTPTTTASRWSGRDNDHAWGRPARLPHRRPQVSSRGSERTAGEPAQSSASRPGCTGRSGRFARTTTRSSSRRRTPTRRAWRLQRVTPTARSILASAARASRGFVRPGGDATTRRS
jgi:hypothetical protein